MGILAWIAIGIALGVVWGALHKTAPPGGRAALYMVAAAGGVLGGLIGTAASSASVTTFFALAPWLTAALGALAVIGVHNVATGTPPVSTDARRWRAFGSARQGRRRGPVQKTMQSGRFRNEEPALPAASADPTSHGTASDSAASNAPVPEWMTEEWKHRVESEARGRLKSEIRGLSKRR